LAGTNGGTNLGGGGGGGSTGTANYANIAAGGNGGSGIVVIQYLDIYAPATVTGSPTYSVAGGFRVYTFNGSGSITF
jgi:hypothetical protein